MYVVLVTDKSLGGTTAYGPYQRLEKAVQIKASFRNPFAAEYFGPDEYDVDVSKLRKAE